MKRFIHLFFILFCQAIAIQGRILLGDFSSFQISNPCTLQIGTSKYRETTSEDCQGYGVLDIGTYEPSQVFLRHLNDRFSTPFSSFDLIDGILWPFYPKLPSSSVSNPKLPSSSVSNPKLPSSSVSNPSTSPSQISMGFQSSHGNLTTSSKMSLMIRSPSHSHVRVVVWCVDNYQSFDFDGLYIFKCKKGPFSADVFLSGSIDFTKGDGYRGFYQVALWSQPLDSLSHQTIYSLDPPQLGIMSQVAIWV